MCNINEAKGGNQKSLSYDVCRASYLWLSQDQNDEESDYFLLVNMITYDVLAYKAIGKNPRKYENMLASKIQRRASVADIAAALLMADINERRPELLEGLSHFRSKVAAIWPTLNEKRRFLKDKKKHEEKKAKAKKKETKQGKTLLTEMPILRS